MYEYIYLNVNPNIETCVHISAYIKLVITYQKDFLLLKFDWIFYRVAQICSGQWNKDNRPM